MQKLLAWLAGFFRPATVEVAPSADLFDPAERMIYRYYTGTQSGARQYKTEDPMTLWKRIMDRGPEISTDWKVAESRSKDNRKAHAKLIATLHEVFGTKPFEEGGLTEIEVKALLNHFLTYVGTEKKSTPTPATSASETSPDTQSSSPPEGEGVPSTPNTSGSGSTESAPSSEPPFPSPTESAWRSAT